jgi:hypothetical protein
MENVKLKANKETISHPLMYALLPNIITGSYDLTASIFFLEILRVQNGNGFITDNLKEIRRNRI